LALPGSPSVPLTRITVLRLRAVAESMTARILRAKGNAAPPRPRISTRSTISTSCLAFMRWIAPKIC
jgi:hypothetical protein